MFQSVPVAPQRGHAKSARTKLSSPYPSLIETPLAWSVHSTAQNRPLAARTRCGRALRGRTGRPRPGLVHRSCHSMLLVVTGSTILRALFFVSLIVPLAPVGCGGDDPPPPYDNYASGDVECRGTDCVCPSTGNCQLQCVGACNLQCAGSGDCDFSCDTGCQTACTGSGDCTVRVGDGGVVQCTGSGDCEVFCDGDCTVECPGSGRCIQHCAPGARCDMTRCGSSVDACPSDTQVCDGACG